MNTLLKRAALAASITVWATMSLGQELSTNRVNSVTDWSIFVEDNPTQCWIVSSPKETVNTRDGRVVAVTRSEILLFVSYWPGAGKLGEVSFTGGYPFDEGSTVKLEISGSSFDLFTTGETAWAASKEEDNKIIAAMKRGAEAFLTGVSSRGTTTRDKFSLLGFTAALADAEKRCSS